VCSTDYPFKPAGWQGGRKAESYIGQRRLEDPRPPHGVELPSVSEFLQSL